jgi:hypothetical protein
MTKPRNVLVIMENGRLVGTEFVREDPNAASLQGEVTAHCQLRATASA